MNSGVNPGVSSGAISGTKWYNSESSPSKISQVHQSSSRISIAGVFIGFASSTYHSVEWYIPAAGMAAVPVWGRSNSAFYCSTKGLDLLCENSMVKMISVCCMECLSLKKEENINFRIFLLFTTAVSSYSKFIMWGNSALTFRKKFYR